MKLIIDIDNNDYELINKTGVTLDLNTVFHGKEKDKEMTFAIFDLVKALKNGIPYEERPQGDLVSREALKKEFCKDIMGGLNWERIIDNASTVVDVTDCENCQFKKFSEDLADKIAKVMADNGITDFDEFAKACGVSFLHQDSITKSDTQI